MLSASKQTKLVSHQIKLSNWLAIIERKETEGWLIKNCFVISTVSTLNARNQLWARGTNLNPACLLKTNWTLAQNPAKLGKSHEHFGNCIFLKSTCLTSHQELKTIFSRVQSRKQTPSCSKHFTGEFWISKENTWLLPSLLWFFFLLSTLLPVKFRALRGQGHWQMRANTLQIRTQVWVFIQESEL